MDINLSQEDKERFKNNPHEFMKELMERNGLIVNGISGDMNALKSSVEDKTIPRAEFLWMHFIYPTSWYSRWRYVYTGKIIEG
jgi:hypothetical protein